MHPATGWIAMNVAYLGWHVPAAYELALRSGVHATSVPVVAHASRPARVLVVLPALTWQGYNPVDDDGDGLPNTLSSGQPIKLGEAIEETA